MNFWTNFRIQSARKKRQSAWPFIGPKITNGRILRFPPKIQNPELIHFLSSKTYKYARITSPDSSVKISAGIFVDENWTHKPWMSEGKCISKLQCEKLVNLCYLKYPNNNNNNNNWIYLHLCFERHNNMNTTNTSTANDVNVACLTKLLLFPIVKIQRSLKTYARTNCSTKTKFRLNRLSSPLLQRCTLVQITK